MIYYHINAFTSDPASGNPAGVVICDSPTSEGIAGATASGSGFPSEETMQSFASQVGFSETAYVKVDGNTVTARYFTPVCEVDLCGHATIAAFKALLDAALISAGKDYTLIARAGKLTIKVEHNFISMETAPGQVLSTVKSPDSINLIYAALSTDYDPVKIMPACNTFINMNPMVTTAGVPFLIVPINGKEKLNQLTPNLPLILEISKGLKCSGIFAFAFEKYDVGTMAHCRGFYPVLGIDEECATGTGVAALSHYLNGYGMFPANREALYIQGEAMNRKSYITAYIKQDSDNSPKHILIGGDAAIVSKETIQL